MLVVAIISSLYVLLISGFIIGLWQLRIKTPPNKTYKRSASIICPFRNEEEHLQNFIRSLSQLQKHSAPVELIFVDDHSNDHGVDVIKQNMHLLSSFSVQVLTLKSTTQFGKKAAQYYGVTQASHDVIVFTDADCYVGENWLHSLMVYKDDGVQMICGPVEYSLQGSWLTPVFFTEFMSLMLSGAGSFGISLPIYCNGANMLMDKNAYLSSLKNIAGTHLASGDDVFLLHSIIKKYGKKSVRFAYTQGAVVQTEAPKTIKQFLLQRSRWASKTSSYKNYFAMYVALVVFMMNLMVLGLFLSSFWNLDNLKIAIMALGVKTFIDTLLFISGYSLFRKKTIILFSLVLQFFYPFYILLTAILALTYTGKWKGRGLKNKPV